MSKKQIAQEVLDDLEAVPAAAETDKEYDRAQDAIYSRRRSLEAALEHHKINGGMLTVAQLIDNAKQFHAYITGESK